MSLMKEKGNVPPRDRIVFLDTETTGMQGGAGMCPFLVGLGSFIGDDFHMLQYFIRDFDEEPSMLYALGELLSRYELVVTYNGAAFDLPLLETRFTLARLDSPFQNMSHLDLLFTARRLWRNGHGSCRLIALEREMLSFFRGPDVPGSMIPRVYFDYLQQRPSSTLNAVFTHNVNDVVLLLRSRFTLAIASRSSPRRWMNRWTSTRSRAYWRIPGNGAVPFSFMRWHSRAVLPNRCGKRPSKSLASCIAGPATMNAHVKSVSN
jgi:uncharacterized protein YprB with RNaseH-like and TPR domain